MTYVGFRAHVEIASRIVSYCRSEAKGIHIPGTWLSREDENCATKGQAQYTSKEIINNDALKVIYTNADDLLNKRQGLKLLIHCLAEPPESRYHGYY